MLGEMLFAPGAGTSGVPSNLMVHLEPAAPGSSTAVLYVASQPLVDHVLICRGAYASCLAQPRNDVPMAVLGRGGNGLNFHYSSAAVDLSALLPPGQAFTVLGVSAQNAIVSARPLAVRPRQ